jgi:hypothetical protein
MEFLPICLFLFGKKIFEFGPLLTKLGRNFTHLALSPTALIFIARLLL